ncbi:hypothetical protein [Maritalea sp.]|uniref:hypothetical protein n=1 Tax=Maritalea sp. TaxID=2003361 RepID=UPI003EF7981D
MDVLLYKKRDLWAATVAALLLAKTYQLKDVAQWAYNLEKYAPHISDAAVAAAWARASDDSIDLDIAEMSQPNLSSQYPETRHLSAKTRRFVDFVATRSWGFG